MPPSRRAAWLRPAIIVLVIMGSYANAIRTPFVFDDIGAVVNNETIRNLWSGHVFSPPENGGTTTGRPTVNFSFAVNYAISGLDPWSYHVGDIIIHVGCALLLFGFLRRTFESPVMRPRWGEAGQALAFWISLIWAVHPINSESVTAIAQRTESLGSFFYLLTLYAFARGAELPKLNRWHIISCVACLIGMGAKEIVATAPVVVAIYDWVFFSETWGMLWASRKKYYIGLAATWSFLIVLLIHGAGSRGASAGFGLGVSAWHYLLKQAEAIVLYLKLCFVPYPLIADYGTAVAKGVGEVWWQGLIVVGLLGTTIVLLARRSPWGFLGTWFFVILAPSSSVVPLVAQTMAEHRMYLPSVAVITVVSLALLQSLRSRAAWLAGVIACIFAIMTVARNRDYRDALTLWSHDVAHYPQSARAHNNLALELQHLGKRADAAREYSAAVERHPTYVAAHYNWGLLLLEDGDLPGALVHLQAATQYGPGFADAHVNFGIALARANRVAEAITQFQDALALQPDAADAHYNLALALESSGRTREAVVHFRSALVQQPNLADAHYHLAQIAEKSGELAEAIDEYRLTLRDTPDRASAHAGLGVLLAQQEHVADATIHLEAAVKLAPGNPDYLGNLGNVYLMQGRVAEAIARYEDSLRISPSNTQLRENLKVAREALESAVR